MRCMRGEERCFYGNGNVKYTENFHRISIRERDPFISKMRHWNMKADLRLESTAEAEVFTIKAAH